MESYENNNIHCDELGCVYNNGSCHCTAEQIHVKKCTGSCTIGPDEPACDTFTQA